jgi:YidC/Oxa1 family membrane protein insertase
MEKRVLLAIFLCFLSLYLWQTLVVKPIPKTAPTTAGTPPPGAPANTAAVSGAAASTPAEAPPPVKTSPSAGVVTGDTTEKTFRVETKDVIAELTNRGARLKSWRLKHYLDQNKQPQELVVDFPSQPLPFTLRTPDEAVTTTLTNALYLVHGSDNALEVGQQSAPVDLAFTYRDSSGLQVTKDFHFDPSGYTVTFRANVQRGDAQAPDDKPLPFSIVWGPAVGDIGENSRYVQKAEALFFQDGKVRRLAAKDFATQPVYEGDFRFAGVDDNYFMTAVLSPGQAKVLYQAVSIPPPANSKDPARELVSFAVEPRSLDTPLQFFAGPKDFDALKALGPELTYAINFGWFRPIVVPLLGSLKWVNGYVGNYGWSIIILTLMINAIMFPLRHKSVVSMRKMQEIQPEVKAIQDRYSKLKATDPAKQKMNTEMMALYRERGVNPASGCVPMLLTMPVLIAFYSLLSTAIELRGAPFFGWIHDLSLHDPLYITPVLMGVTMVWQQRLAPAAGADPAQQKMMMFMPIVFTFMFLWAPAGVAVYWLMSNLWAIGQQYATNYMIGPPNVRNVRPPAERRVKRVGSGKTEAAAREQ